VNTALTTPVVGAANFDLVLTTEGLNQKFIMGNSNIAAIAVCSNNVGIRTLAPQYALDVNGMFNLHNNLHGMITSQFTCLTTDLNGVRFTIQSTGFTSAGQSGGASAWPLKSTITIPSWGTYLVVASAWTTDATGVWSALNKNVMGVYVVVWMNNTYVTTNHLSGIDIFKNQTTYPDFYLNASGLDGGAYTANIKMLRLTQHSPA
jgi:hypothetical protein